VAEGGALGLRPPTLVSVHRSSATPFAAYLGRQRKAAERLGLRFWDVALPAEASATTLREQLQDLGDSEEVDAVLVEHPLPSDLDFAGALGALPPEKDVDGVGAVNQGRLVEGRPLHVPAVASAALDVLRHYGRRIAGARVAVLGRSPTVGLPLALLLARKGSDGDATVTLVHSATPDLAAAISACRILVSCVGRPGLLTRSTVPRSSTVIDVGLSTVPAPSPAGGMQLAGDAVAEEMDGWAEAYTPVPGGVGPVTVAELMWSAAKAWRMQRFPGAR
jgi:methylenetetrahydrofolate dehydrogenase (NADP+)/methenyltetrahydrofolate cyclohydrolase